MVEDLGPQWHRAVEETAPGALVVPEAGLYVRRGADGVSGVVLWYATGEEVPSEYTAILRVDGDGPAVWLERETGTVRRWAVVPPRHEQVVYIDYAHEVTRCSGARIQEPSDITRAWMLLTDWLAFLAAPSVVESECIEHIAKEANTALGLLEVPNHEAYRGMVKTCLSRIVEECARATTAPRSLAWITGEAVRQASVAGDGWERAAARLRQLGGAQ